MADGRDQSIKAAKATTDVPRSIGVSSEDFIGQTPLALGVLGQRSGRRIIHHWVRHAPTTVLPATTVPIGEFPFDFGETAFPANWLQQYVKELKLQYGAFSSYLLKVNGFNNRRIDTVIALSHARFMKTLKDTQPRSYMTLVQEIVMR